MWLPSFQLCCQQRGSPPGLQHEWQRKCARLTCGSVGVGDSVWTKEAGQTWCEWWNIFVDSLFFQLPACFADNLPIWAKTAKQIKLALDSSKRLRICWGLGMNLILGIMGFDRNSSHQTCRKQTSKFQWIAPQVHKKVDSWLLVGTDYQWTPRNTAGCSAKTRSIQNAVCCVEGSWVEPQEAKSKQ